MNLEARGSSVSVRSTVRMGSAMSMLKFAVCASSMSLRSFARVSANASVVDFVAFGSCLSVRHYSRLSSSVSILGLTALGSCHRMSVIQKVSLGSALSILDIAHVGSTPQHERWWPRCQPTFRHS